MPSDQADTRRFKARLSSFSGRYMVLAALFSILLLAAALFGRAYVDHNTGLQITHIEQRSQTANVTADVMEQVRSVESRIQRFLIVPSDTNRKRVGQSTKLHQAAIGRLANTEWIKQHAEMAKLVSALEDDAKHLNDEVERLIKRRSDTEAWFPAMGIMRDRMLADNEEISTALNLAISESRTNMDEPAQREIYLLMTDVRYALVRMISEFRLYVSNRFGIFSARSDSSMAARARNVELYLERLRSLIDRLAGLDQAGQLTLQQSAAVTTVRTRLRSWEHAYSRVKEILASEAWRTDIALLRHSIDPLLERIRHRTSTLQLELGVGSARDITRLTTIARRLSDFVFILAAGGIFVVVLSYLIFNRALIKPIARITHALKAEAQGDHGVIIPPATAEETRDLTDAFSEMREQVRLRQWRLDYMAHHDSLTNLPNRVLFRDRLEHALQVAERDQSLVGVLFLDLDRFKQINDSLGHNVGDQLLVKVGDRIQKLVRRSDTVARLGGDEFAVVVEGIGEVDQVALLAEKLLDGFAKPLSINGRSLHVTTSIGIALFPMDDRSADALIRDADTAMYHAKELGRNSFQFFSAEMSVQVAEHMELEMHLRRAAEENQFRVHYQPIINMSDNRICGCEALLRWDHPNEGPISPARFVPVLDETGLIVPVTEWLIEQVGQQYRATIDAGLWPIALSVNLSGRLLQSERFVDSLVTRLDKSGMLPENLIVEITEDTLLQDLRAAEISLRTLKNMGVRIALDDFGTGQSSLNHLRRFPFDIIKIDRDFVRDVPGDRYDSDLVKAVIAMAHSLGMKVVAEGVESEKQLAFLNQHHCDHVQGYLLSQPVSPNTALQMLTESAYLTHGPTASQHR